MRNYQVLVHRETVDRAIAYMERIVAGSIPGSYLQSKLRDRDVSQISIAQFIELLLRTKRPQIFAESAVYGNGTDWNQIELGILGDISIATPVTVYDNGRHRLPSIHAVPFAATLIFTPGALLRNDCNTLPADWEAVTTGDEIDPVKYYRLYERRLLPAFSYADKMAKSRQKMALITIPGLGCGQFAGKFRGQLGAELQQVLITFLQAHGAKFSHLKVIYFDPYSECDNERVEIGNTSLLVRPLLRGNDRKSQLCQPIDYAEDGDNFTDCELFSLVAWDHVSWPGNDFYLGARSTDDGVKAAATDAMRVMTGIVGTYNGRTNCYDPPPEYPTWKDVIRKNRLELKIFDESFPQDIRNLMISD